MLETDDLLVQPRDDGALWLTFNRPAVFNAFSGELSVALAERLEGAASNDDVRAVVDRAIEETLQAVVQISGERTGSPRVGLGDQRGIVAQRRCARDDVTNAASPASSRNDVREARPIAELQECLAGEALASRPDLDKHVGGFRPRHQGHLTPSHRADGATST